jgi:hypothetical protein
MILWGLEDTFEVYGTRLFLQTLVLESLNDIWLSLISVSGVRQICVICCVGSPRKVAKPKREGSVNFVVMSITQHRRYLR